MVFSFLIRVPRSVRRFTDGLLAVSLLSANLAAQQNATAIPQASPQAPQPVNREIVHQPDYASSSSPFPNVLKS